LKSLWALNQSFRGFVCFQGLDPIFVSPFSPFSPSPPSRPSFTPSPVPALSRYDHHSRFSKDVKILFCFQEINGRTTDAPAARIGSVMAALDEDEPGHDGGSGAQPERACSRLGLFRLVRPEA